METVPKNQIGQLLSELGWSPIWTLESAVQRWDNLVSSIEGGYPDSIEDYANDLAVREWLEDAISHLVASEALALEAALKTVDERFVSATYSGREFVNAAEKEWWYRRLPKIAVGDLKKDIDSIGPE